MDRASAPRSYYDIGQDFFYLCLKLDRKKNGMKRVRGEDSEQGAARSGSQLRWEVVQSRVLPPTSRQAVAAAKSVEQPAGPVAETLPPAVRVANALRAGEGVLRARCIGTALPSSSDLAVHSYKYEKYENTTRKLPAAFLARDGHTVSCILKS